MASDSDDSAGSLEPYVDRPIVDFADFVRGQEDLAKRVKAFKKSRKKLVETQQAMEALWVQMDAAVKTASEAIKDIEDIKQNMLSTMDKNLREKLEKEMLTLQQGNKKEYKEGKKKEEGKKEQEDQDEVDETKEQKQSEGEIETMENKEQVEREKEQEEKKEEDNKKEKKKEKDEKKEKIIKETRKEEEETIQHMQSTSQKSKKKSVRKTRSKK